MKSWNYSIVDKDKKIELCLVKNRLLKHACK